MSEQRKKTRAKHFVLVMEDFDGAHSCDGVYENAAEAWGNMLLNILDFAASYREDGDIFEIGLPIEMDCNGGYCVTVKYKKKDWDIDPEEHRYYILFEGEVEIND